MIWFKERTSTPDINVWVKCHNGNNRMSIILQGLSLHGNGKLLASSISGTVQECTHYVSVCSIHSRQPCPKFHRIHNQFVPIFLFVPGFHHSAFAIQDQFGVRARLLICDSCLHEPMQFRLQLMFWVKRSGTEETLLVDGCLLIYGFDARVQSLGVAPTLVHIWTCLSVVMAC